MNTNVGMRAEYMRLAEEALYIVHTWHFGTDGLKEALRKLEADV